MKLVGNHVDVVKFGRGAVGQSCNKPHKLSWLGDQMAQPGVEWEGAVDAAFRHVAHALPVGVEEKQMSVKRLRVAPEGPGVYGL